MEPWDFGKISWLRRNPYDLIPGLRDLAKASGIKLGPSPNDTEIQMLFDVWGSERAFVENVPVVAAALKLDGMAVPDQAVLDLLMITETLYELAIRSARGKHKGSFSHKRFTVVVPTGTANWTKRRVHHLLAYYLGENFGIDCVFALASERLCTLDTEVNNQLVKALSGNLGRPPTEAELLSTYLAAADFNHELIVGGSVEEQVAKLVAVHPDITKSEVLVVTNANATYVPLAVRRFIKQVDPAFDRTRTQFWFTQDDFELARTPEEAADTDNYQRPLTVFSGLVRLVNELYQLRA